MTDLLDRIVSHVLDTPFEAFSDDVLAAGRDRLVDAIGCTVSGARVAGNEPYAQLLRRWGGAGEAAVLGTSTRLPVAHAALLNSLQTRSFDFEVCGPEGEGANAGKMVGHVGSTTEPTALSVAEHLGATGAELLAAVIVGGDVAARVAVSDTVNFEKSFEVCGTANAFGAVAVVGRLMKLDHAQLRNAFGIALNTMAGSFQSVWDGVASFKLPGANAAHQAVMACEVAAAGAEGTKDALTSPSGYFNLYGLDPNPDAMLVDLGEVFYVHGQHKLHPSCYGNHNPIECALQVRAQAGFDVTRVAAINLEVQPNRIKHFLNQPFTTADGQAKALFNIPYAIGNALLRGRPELEHYLDESIHDADVLALVEKVELVPHSVGANAHGSRLVVTLDDGTTFDATREVPAGWKANPVTSADIDDKYWRNVTFHGGLERAAADRALTLLRDVENCADAGEIARLLAL